MMYYIDEHLNYIYLREDIENAAEEIISNDSIPKNKKDVDAFLNNVPILKAEEIKKEFNKKSTTFNKHFKEGMEKMGEQASREKTGEGLILLYAAAKSSADAVKDTSKRNKLYKIIDKVFNSVWNKPGRLFRKGAGIWLSSFILLFLFWWLPPMRTIAKVSGKAGLLMMMIGLVLSITKLFFKELAK
jgi:hypothetical protein